MSDTGQRRRVSDSKSHVERWLPVYLTLAVTVAAFASVATWVGSLDHKVERNSSAIVRSCEILNAAITESQRAQGGEPTRILVAAILDGKPQVAESYAMALKRSKPALAQVDCERVKDPAYQPYRR